MQLFPASGRQGSAALTNNKQENVDRIQANNLIKKVRICKTVYESRGLDPYQNATDPEHGPKQGYVKKFKTCRDPYLGLYGYIYLCMSTKLQSIS